MKKLLIYCLSLISVAFISVAFSLSGSVLRGRADDSSVTLSPTETFLPSSALQLYDLTSPMAVSYSSSGYLVITEHIGNADGTSLFDKISIYNPNTEKYSAIPDHPTISNVTHATEWNGFIFYLSSSHLYYVLANDLTATPIETAVTSSNFFMIKGEFLLTNTNNTIVIYKISVDGNLPSFEKLSTHNFTTKNAFISQNNDIYYLFGGKLYCFEVASSTSYVVASVSIDVNYMTEYEDYIYLTSGSGIFKVQKGKGKEIELITPITTNESSLGYTANPQGVTVMNGTLVFADPTNKSIQAVTPNGNFTDFAITTESTAKYRLTNNASHLSLSENYAYVLDDGAQNDQGISYKRIVRTALDKTIEDRYLSISLAPLYNGEEAIDVKLLACSDTHLGIYHGKLLSIYQIENNELKLVFEKESESVTSLFYLDGEFYYTDYALLYFGYNAVNINRITLPNEDNGVTNITVEKINSQTEIKGVATNACVDVFGNFYINVADSIEGENQKLIKYSNGVTTELATTNKKFISFKADFAGNVYGLANDGLIYKYSYNALNNDLSIFKLDTELPIKNIDLNYRSNVCYALSNACILNSKGDVMNIANLSEVGKANALNTVLDKVEGKFVTIDKNAKLFKVTLGDYTESGNFKTITPVTNPYPEKVYLVIDEIDNYYLVSCFDKFVALVRKTETKYSPDSNFTLAIIGEDYYDAFKISVNEVNETFVISNQTTVFAKPIFSQNYALQTIDKNTSVKALLEVKFNGVSMTLITTSEDNEPLGFIVSGYLNGELESTVTTTTNKTAIVSSDGKKHFNTVLMITIIAFTLTFVALFIEKKLLFDKEDGNKN